MKWSILFVTFCLVLGCKSIAPPLKDGTYYGYEFLSNLSPDDPDRFWYYSGVLHIENGKANLKQSPTYKTNGKVWASESDGGFPEYDGKVEIFGKRVIVSLRKVSCDYCPIPVDDPLPSKIEREYILRFIGDGSFELNDVVYRQKPDPELEWKP